MPSTREHSTQYTASLRQTHAKLTELGPVAAPLVSSCYLYVAFCLSLYDREKRRAPSFNVESRTVSSLTGTTPPWLTPVTESCPHSTTCTYTQSSEQLQNCATKRESQNALIKPLKCPGKDNCSNASSCIRP